MDNYELTSNDINQFLHDLKCVNGKHGYYRAMRAFCNWLYSNDYVNYNPIDKVDPPKPTKRILPILSPYIFNVLYTCKTKKRFWYILIELKSLGEVSD